MTTLLEAFFDQSQKNQQQSMGNIQQAGAIQGMQQNARKNALEQQYRQELAALGPNPSQEQLVAVTAKYASPDKLMDVQQKSLDRQSQAQETASRYTQMFQQRADALEERRRQFDEKKATDAERAQFNEWFKTQQLAQSQQMNNLNAQLRVMGIEIQKQGNEIKLAQFNAVEREKEDKAIEQQIKSTQDKMKDAVPMWTAAKQLNDIMSRYAPEEAPGLGYAKNTDWGKIFLTAEGKDLSSSQKLLGNSILKYMSGAAVTAPEEIRNMAATMADGRFSAKDFYIAWPKVSTWINDQLSVGMAGLTPKAKERFQERTRLDFDPIKPRFAVEYDDQQRIRFRDSFKPEAKAGSPTVVMPEFASAAEAEAAAKAGKIKAGDKIKVGGQSGTWK